MEKVKTDNDKAALDDNDIACLEAFSKTKWISHLEFNDGWNAALAHAETQHAERVKALIEGLLIYTDKDNWGCSECLHGVDHDDICLVDTWEGDETDGDMVARDALEKYRGKE